MVLERIDRAETSPAPPLPRRGHRHPKATTLAALVAVVVMILFAAMPGWPVRRLIRDWTNEDCTAAPEGHGVVALGDSLTEMNSDPSWHFLGTDSWFALAACQHRIRYGYDAGVIGNTTAQMASRFTPDVAEHHPSEVVILGGTNDALRHIPTSTTLHNLQTLVRRSQALRARVLIGTIPPMDWQPDEPWVTRINAGIRRLAADDHIGLIDFHGAVAVGTRYHPGWDIPGGVHPDHAGAVAMEHAFLKAQR